ncbi:class I SAM-dependent methyltransferase [Streptomyces sp. NPDC127079]|uniref:class I SAM-dependent methyltransferase n=1 Tax=Streptomyces sp. NPDC127079 TaxID=3347132 RepID=UPI00365B10D2
MKYTQEFYEEYVPGSESSAKVVVPMIMELVRPTSVIDVGCGVGGWLEEFRRQGVEDVIGIDGEWVPPTLLKIPAERFRAVDLERLGAPEKTFDLAMCLEVAEHLQESAGRDLVSFLTRSADFVAFSAAIPGQGGTGHINEQWLDYWSRFFDAHDYRLFDPIRAVLWDDESVEPWYAQNLVFFARSGADADSLAKLAAGHAKNAIPVKAVHPGMREATYS